MTLILVNHGIQLNHLWSDHYVIYERPPFLIDVIREQPRSKYALIIIMESSSIILINFFSIHS